MSMTTLHPLAADYVDRLRQACRRLPRDRRDELVAEIEAHLADALGPNASAAEVLTVLDRLGEPEAIADAEEPREAVSDGRRGTQEWAAIFLLLFGGFVFGVGWLAGLVLLWGSRAWTTRGKWIGTLILPGGLATGMFVALLVGGSGGQVCVSSDTEPEQCFGGPSAETEILLVITVLLCILAPIASAIYLASRAGKAAT